MFGVGVDRITKEDQLNNRDSNGHCKSEPISHHLLKFFDEHSLEATQRKFNHILALIPEVIFYIGQECYEDVL